MIYVQLVRYERLDVQSDLQGQIHLHDMNLLGADMPLPIQCTVADDTMMKGSQATRLSCSRCYDIICQNTAVARSVCSAPPAAVLHNCLVLIIWQCRSRLAAAFLISQLLAWSWTSFLVAAASPGAWCFRCATGLVHSNASRAGTAETSQAHTRSSQKTSQAHTKSSHGS